LYILLMTKPEVIAPAGNLASLKAAVDSGADAVYLGFSDSTNARNFEGLNFTFEEIEDGIRYVRAKGRKCAPITAPSELPR